MTEQKYRSRSNLEPCPRCQRRVMTRQDGRRARHRTGHMGIDGPLCPEGPKDYSR